MCSRVRCHSCKKITWSGCGAHIDSVFRGVPEKDRCSCKSNQPSFGRQAQSGDWLSGWLNQGSNRRR